MSSAQAAGQADGIEIAQHLNARFDAAIGTWQRGGDGMRFAWKSLHSPGNRTGEGRGIFYQRPSNPRRETNPALFEGPPCRRFDPRRLPPGLVQAVGHTADRKCREMLGCWADDAPAIAGVMRHLETDGKHMVRYTHGTPSSIAPEAATMIFLDGQMAKAAPQKYELLDLRTLQAHGRV